MSITTPTVIKSEQLDDNEHDGAAAVVGTANDKNRSKDQADSAAAATVTAATSPKSGASGPLGSSQTQPVTSAFSEPRHEFFVARFGLRLIGSGFQICIRVL